MVSRNLVYLDEADTGLSSGIPDDRRVIPRRKSNQQGSILRFFTPFEGTRHLRSVFDRRNLRLVGTPINASDAYANKWLTHVNVYVIIFSSAVVSALKTGRIWGFVSSSGVSSMLDSNRIGITRMAFPC